MHWDLRLERDGVLKSWAVPKGPPTGAGAATGSPSRPRTTRWSTRPSPATIAAGEYGGGHVTIWDAGRYATEKWDDRHIIVTFDGRRLAGRYALFPLDDGAWNIRKLDATAARADPAAGRAAADAGHRRASCRRPTRTRAGATSSSGTASGRWPRCTAASWR